MLLVALGAFGWLVWPTPYRAIAVNPLMARAARIFAARENRVTGTVQFLTRDGWRSISAADTAADPLARYRQGLP